MSKTPRTDEQLKFEAFFDGIGIVETVEIEFAQQLETELADARAEIERLNGSLAACGVMALANTRESAAEAEDVLPEYRSSSLENVAFAIDREMLLREKNTALNSKITRALDLLNICLDSYALNRHLLNQWELLRLGEIKSAIAALSAAERGE